VKTTKPLCYVRTSDDSRHRFLIDRLDGEYSKWCQSAGGAGELHFTVDRLPKSLNHQYVIRGRGIRDLDPETKALRDSVRYKLANVSFKPVGLLSAVIVFGSPSWLTKANTVRDVDVDNKVKPLMDAFELATGIRDSRFWALHAFKTLAAVDVTRLSVYDLGDVVGR
jgi:hypothetical protein